jgi:hypothetical protein
LASESRLWKSRKAKPASQLSHSLDYYDFLTGYGIRILRARSYRAGSLQGAGGKAQVTAEQMEISRLRAELARVTMERDILGKATAYFAKGQK